MCLSKIKKVYSLVLLFTFFTFATASVLAEDEVKLKIDPGFDGCYKSYGTVPINITITNNSDEELQGVVYILSDKSDNSSRYYQNITVGKNTTKEVTLLVSQAKNMSLLNPDQNVYFEVDGKEVAKEKIGEIPLPEGQFLIGVLANDNDADNFLTSTGIPIKSFFKTVELTDEKNAS